MFTRSSSFPRGFFLGRGGFLVFFLALWGSRCGLIFLSELSFHFFLHHDFYRIQKLDAFIDGFWLFVGSRSAPCLLVSHDSFAFL